jgi:hypothetical protein
VAALCKVGGRQYTSHYWVRSEMPWVRADGRQADDAVHAAI